MGWSPGNAGNDPLVGPIAGRFLPTRGAVIQMSSWAVALMSGGGIAALSGLIQYVLRLRFLWRVYERGGRNDLMVAGKVTTWPIEALRRKCQGCHDSSINDRTSAVEHPQAGDR